MFDFFRGPRRAELREEGLDDASWALLDRAVPLFQRLDDAARKRLGGLTRIFLDEKTFDGGGGFEVTETMKLVIAAEACFLLVYRNEEVPYPELLSIVVYEDAWKTTRKTNLGGVLAEQESANSGESWSQDLVILSWANVRRDAAGKSPGNNVVFHEFAHQLDAADGTVDGSPELPNRARYARWSSVFSTEYEALVARFQAGRPSDIDSYATTNPPEFFAVVTEEFYETPDTLAAKHPELFAELVAFYGVDPRKL